MLRNVKVDFASVAERMISMEQTLVLVKPDGVEQRLIGEIISRFEKRGFIIKALKMLVMSEQQAQAHYAEHQGKSFFRDLVLFITSGPIVAMVVQGEEAVKIVRMMMGTTNPSESLPGTIRGDFATQISRNIIHGSDSKLSAEREIAIYFTEQEIVK
jgi:nucleoside-diphosphate kinase